MSTSTRMKNLGLPALVVLVLLIVFGAVFLFELLSFTPDSAGGGVVTADSYRAELVALPDVTDISHGEALFESYGCAACHDSAASTGVAPSMTGISERAGERRPPLPADAYLYESVVHPADYLVESYSNVMPQNFRDRMTDQELADVIAYLQTR